MSEHRERPIAFVNAAIEGSGASVLRIRGERIISVGTPAERGDQVVDLRGERLLPGLINAHDHLQLNNYPRLKYRARYDNASQWTADIDLRREVDAQVIECSAVPRADRLVMGGLKNLLSGVTTVAHHDPFYPELASADFPLHVLSRYGWGHSLAIDGAAGVRQSHRATPLDTPWFIHAGEGTDAAASAEAAQLEALQVLTPNTVLIHGLAFDASVRARLVERGVGLVWCPGSNRYLYDRDAAVRDCARAGLLALGSDSRLSGERDLLDELQFARRTGEVDDELLESLVTTNGARLLRLADRGELRVGCFADLVVVPRAARLWELRRADLRCVIARGEMRYGDGDLAECLLSQAGQMPFMVDGRHKYLARSVAMLLERPAIREPGVEPVAGAVRAA